MQLITFFHLNLAFSSIPEEQRGNVIARCYWPLLNIVERHKVPFGIEASAYTLQVIQDIDPSWVTKLRHDKVLRYLP